MIDVLAAIVFFGFLISIICFVIGLIVPATFARLFGKNLGRKITGLVFAGITIMLFIFFGVLVENSPSSQKNNTETASNKTMPTGQPSLVPAKAQAKKPTPVPTEDCSQSAYPDMCIRMEINREPKLNATTQLTNAGLVVTNNGDVDWRLCTVTIGSSNNINTAYEVAGWDIGFPAHQSTTVAWGDFTLTDGTRFNYYTTQPNDIELDCSVNHNQEHLRIN